MMNPAPAIPRSYWLALGVFDARESLRSVLAELAAGGFGAERFCIVRLPASRQWAEGRPEDPAITGDSACPTTSPHEDSACPTAALYEDSFARLFTDMQEVQGFHHDGTYAFSTGALLDELLTAAQNEADGKLRCPAWMTQAQCDHLSAHLRRGGAALIVRSESAAEQDASSRALLRHSSHIVWTYDFSQVFASRPAPDGE